MTLSNIITFDLLSYYDGKIKNWVKALKASASQDGLMSKEDFEKLDGIASGAQVNVLEGVQLDGTDLTIDGNKKVNIQLSSTFAGKADKVSNATADNFAGLDANGNLKDSGKSASDFATATQGGYADSALQSISNGTDGTYVTTTIGTKAGNNGAKGQTIGVAVTTADPSTATQANNGLATAYDVQLFVNSKVAAGINYKGTVVNYSALPSNPAAGDMYNVTNDETVSGTFYPGDMNYIWADAVGTQGQEDYVAAHWDPASPIIKLEVATETQINSLFTA